MYRNCFKRVLDFVCALIGIVLLSWLLVIVALAVKLTSKGPVLFRQKRIGKGKKEFMILKFRSMYTETPKDMPTHLLENPNAFITPVGRFIRKTSLDELPQLFNILAGQMAVVGPRPALWNQYDLIAERDRYGANDIRPGLTGWAQVNGRDELPIPVKAKFDGEYVGKIGFAFDCRIIWRTAIQVVHSEGVVEGAAANHAEEDRK